MTAHVWADDVSPEHVTIRLSGAEIARLPAGPAKDYLLALLARQVQRLRRAASEQAQFIERVQLEEDRLRNAAQERYAAMAEATAARYAAARSTPVSQIAPPTSTEQRSAA